MTAPCYARNWTSAGPSRSSPIAAIGNSHSASASVSTSCAGGSKARLIGKYQMSRLYGPIHRLLQDCFDSRRLADNVEARVVLTEIPPEHKAFIESRDMFFLSTVDHQGRPTVSYKGGDLG